MFETAMFSELLSQFCATAHKNAKDKGFWDEQEISVLAEDNIPTGAPTFVIPQRPINLGEKYMLMVSELCELFEAHRKGKLTAPCDKPCHIIDPKATEPIRIKCEACSGSGKVHSPGESIRIGEYSTIENAAYCASCTGAGSITTTGIRPLTNEEEEIADLLIRVADYCGYRGINLGAAILSKMRYNTTRPHMHGNKLC